MVTITISIRPCLAAYLYVQPPEIYNYPGRDRAPPTANRSAVFWKSTAWSSGMSEEGIIRTFQRWRKKMRAMERGVKSFFINC